MIKIYAAFIYCQVSRITVQNGRGTSKYQDICVRRLFAYSLVYGRSDVLIMGGWRESLCF
jgi:hypothetical protein